MDGQCPFTTRESRPSPPFPRTKEGIVNPSSTTARSHIRRGRVALAVALGAAGATATLAFATQAGAAPTPVLPYGATAFPAVITPAEAPVPFPSVITPAGSPSPISLVIGV